MDRVMGMRITISKYQPLRGGSYIILPKYIYDKKTCINAKNKDDNCLRWVLRSARFPADNHTDRISSYPSEDGFNFDGIDFPTPINQIKKVNKMAINVYDYKNNAINVRRVTNQPPSMARINLLLIYE